MATVVTTALGLVVGPLVVNAMRGDREQVMTGAVIVLGITYALRRLRSEPA